MGGPSSWRQLLILVASNPRRRFLAPLLVALTLQLYGWWLQRRRRKEQAIEGGDWANSAPSQPRRLPVFSSACHAPHWSPPARPGVDGDPRLVAVDDDPRYFKGAVLGKAQRAALGEVVDPGGNTVSWDPNSTLVPPSIRVVHVPEPVQPEDVVMVPDHLCVPEDWSLYEALLREARQASAEGACGALELSPSLREVAGEVCESFSISKEGAQVQLAWYECGGSMPTSLSGTLEPCTGPAGVSLGGSCCRAHVVLGGPCELVLRRQGLRGHLSLPCRNGSVCCLGSRVLSRWQQELHGASGAAAAAAAAGAGAAGEEAADGVTCPAGLLVIAVAGLPQASAPSPAEARSEETRALEASGGAAEEEGSSPGAGLSVAWDATLPRPLMRIITVRDSRSIEKVSHDDVIVLPEFFCKKEDWGVYYQLIQEARESQARGEKEADWVSWHEGAHLLTKNPTGSAAFRRVVEQICEQFCIANGDRWEAISNNSIGTRFNWYRDGSDWKPFHHDSAAFNVQRSRLQNCTVGVSFGASRELAFRHARTGELVYFPQTNGMLFFFGRDVNIRWQHGVNALPVEQQDGKGRVSIILWGLCDLAVEEPGSPPMLPDNTSCNNNRKGCGKGGGHTLRPPPGGYVASGDSPACRDFQQGRCTFGARCKYSHVPSARRAGA